MSYQNQNAQRADKSGLLCQDEILQGVLNSSQDALTVTPLGGTAGTPSGSVQTVQGALAGVALPQAGFCTAVALAVTASSAYTAGDSVGGKITITNAVRAAGLGVIINSVVLLDRAAQSVVGNIYIFSSDPAAATLTDKTAFVFSTDDLKVVGKIPVAAVDWTTTNTKQIAQPPFNSFYVKPTTGTSLYAAFIATTTPTFAATTNVQITFAGLQD